MSRRTSTRRLVPVLLAGIAAGARLPPRHGDHDVASAQYVDEPRSRPNVDLVTLTNRKPPHASSSPCAWTRT